MDGGILVSEIDSLELVQDDPREYHKVISSSEGKYCCRTMTAIQVIYLIAAASWLLLLYLHGLFNKLDVVTACLMAIPLIAFGFGFYNTCSVTGDIEETMLGANYLSFGFLITIILINWNSPTNTAEKAQFFKILVSAFILIMISMIDIWVSREDLSIVYHFKSILNTAALALLATALYLYYRSHSDSVADLKLATEE